MPLGLRRARTVCRLFAAGSGVFRPPFFGGGWSPMTSSAMWVFSVCAVDRLERTNAAVPVGTLFAGVPRVACCCTFCCRCVFLAAFLGTCAWGLPQFSFCRSSASPSTPLLPPPLWCAARAFPFFGLRDAVPTGQEGKSICGERRDVLRFLWGEGNAGCSVLFRSCNLYAAAAPCTRPCAVRVFATHTSPPFFSLSALLPCELCWVLLLLVQKRRSGGFYPAHAHSPSKYLPGRCFGLVMAWH